MTNPVCVRKVLGDSSATITPGTTKYKLETATIAMRI
jgi:hypothetical protein